MSSVRYVQMLSETHCCIFGYLQDLKYLVQYEWEGVLSFRQPV